MPSLRRRPLAVLAAALTALTLQGLHTAPRATAQARADGKINVIADHSGLCIEADNSRVTEGTPITQNRCTEQSGATWILRESIAGGGAVNLYNPTANKCLKIRPATASGLRLAELSACTDTPASSFRMEDRQHHAWLRSVESPQECLEVAAGSHVNHTVVRLAPCNGQPGTAFRQRPPRKGDDPARDVRRFGIERVNITSFGEQTAEGIGTDYTIDSTSISADNRYVTFASTASTLVGDDTNGVRDIFLRDRHTAELRRISVPNGGGQTNGHSHQPMISADGRYVVFQSGASNLAPGDANNASDVFLYDADTRKIELISKNTAGQPGALSSQSAAVSADGRYVTFESYAADLVPGGGGSALNIFVRDRTTGATQRVSVPNAGGQGNGWSEEPKISADGRYITFSSLASNLVPGDVNLSRDVFLWDRNRQTDALRRVTTYNATSSSVVDSRDPVISADGAFVAFTSDLPLVAGDTNDQDDVYVWNRRSGATSRVSVGNDGVDSRQASYGPSISGDGHFIAFTSNADAFAPGTAPGRDVFVRDLLAGTTVHASAGDEGAPGNGQSFHAEISADGKFVSFESDAPNLAFGDTNNASDFFVKPRPLDLT